MRRRRSVRACRCSCTWPTRTNTPPEPELGRWQRAITGAGAELSVHRYPGVGHLYTDPDLPEYSPDADRGGLAARAGLPGCPLSAWAHRTDPEAWWSGPANGVSKPGLVMETQPAAVISRIRAAYDKLSARYRGQDGLLALPTAALLASASVPQPPPARPHAPRPPRRSCSFGRRYARNAPLCRDRKCKIADT